MTVMIKRSQIDNRYKRRKTTTTATCFLRNCQCSALFMQRSIAKALGAYESKHTHTQILLLSYIALENHSKSNVRRMWERTNSEHFVPIHIFGNALRQPEFHWTSIFFFAPLKLIYIQTTKTDRLICRFFLLYYCVMLELPTNAINHDKSAIFGFYFSFLFTFSLILSFIFNNVRVHKASEKKLCFKNCSDALNTINFVMFTFPFYSCVRLDWISATSVKESLARYVTTLIHKWEKWQKREKVGNYGWNAQRANHSFSSDYFNLLYFCAYFPLSPSISICAFIWMFSFSVYVVSQLFFVRWFCLSTFIPCVFVCVVGYKLSGQLK